VDQRLEDVLNTEGPYEGVVTRFSTESRPAVRFVQIPAPGQSAFTVSFSEDMDPETLAQVKIVDASGAEVPATRTWRGGELHELDLVSEAGGVDVLIDVGVLSRTGETIEGAPFRWSERQ
jgi:hypothetical protein